METLLTRTELYNMTQRLHTVWIIHYSIERGGSLSVTFPNPFGDAAALAHDRTHIARRCTQQCNGFQQVGLAGAVWPDKNVERTQSQRFAFRPIRKQVLEMKLVEKAGVAAILCHRSASFSVNCTENSCHGLYSETAILSAV